MARYSLNGDRKRNRFGFLKLFLEIPVIVFSIYIAFVVDEYGKAKEEAELEQKYLRELFEEVKINNEELKADQDARRDQIVLLDKMLETPIRRVAPDTLRMAMNELLNFRIYSPTDAVYQDLVSSGNLRLITSDSLRHVILQYRRMLSRVPVTEQGDIDLIKNQIEPYLVERKVLSLLEPLTDVPGIATPDIQKDRIIRVLLNDRGFIDLVYLRRQRIRQTVYFANPMQWHLREMVELIQSEIEASEEAD